MEGLCNLAKTYAPLVGRFLITFIFLRSAFGKIGSFAGVAGGMTAKGMPYAEFFLVCAITIEIVGGLCVLTGWQARWGALALLIFLIPATLIFHNYWAVDPAQAKELANQTNHFFKNLTIMGALVFVIGMGSGPLSIGRSGQKA
ncbi:MAG TPA: DoxX family protein [Burkholderiales bacterium]|jgi:putative oxidoreductase|nr:DoxX family protein [Burkholderiales bacterium]